MPTKKLDVAPITNEIRYGTIKGNLWGKYDVIPKDEFLRVLFEYVYNCFDGKKNSLSYGFEGWGDIHIVYLPEKDCKDYKIKLVKKEVDNDEQST